MRNRNEYTQEIHARTAPPFSAAACSPLSPDAAFAGWNLRLITAVLDPALAAALKDIASNNARRPSHTSLAPSDVRRIPTPLRPKASAAPPPLLQRDVRAAMIAELYQSARQAEVGADTEKASRSTTAAAAIATTATWAGSMADVIAADSAAAPAPQPTRDVEAHPGGDYRSDVSSPTHFEALDATVRPDRVAASLPRLPLQSASSSRKRRGSTSGGGSARTPVRPPLVVGGSAGLYASTPQQPASARTVAERRPAGTPATARTAAAERRPAGTPASARTVRSTRTTGDGGAATTPLARSGRFDAALGEQSPSAKLRALTQEPSPGTSRRLVVLPPPSARVLYSSASGRSTAAGFAAAAASAPSLRMPRAVAELGDDFAPPPLPQSLQPGLPGARRARSRRAPPPLH